MKMIAFAAPGALPLRGHRSSCLSPTKPHMSLLPIQGPLPAQGKFNRLNAERETFTPTTFCSDLSENALGPRAGIQALRTLLGNAHFFEPDICSMRKAITHYQRSGNTREFVRNVAKSSAFQDRFFFGMSNARFIELAFKLLLGRAPQNQGEVIKAGAVLLDRGYDSFIDWIVDGKEYAARFGASLVPKFGAYGEHVGGMPGFSATMKLQLPTRGANSDVTCTTSQITYILAGRNPAGVVEIKEAYDVNVPKYEPMNWMKLPTSTLSKDWSSATLVTTDVVGSWKGVSKARATGEATSEWRSGWKPETVGDNWAPGWYGSKNKVWV